MCHSMATVAPRVGDGHERQTSAQARRRIARAIAEIDHVLPGTITVRLGPCGKPACRCHGEPPQLHGPYISWTRKIDGKTVTRLLTEEQWADYKPWFENAKRLKELTAELETLSLVEIDGDPRWRRK
jgi:hypothetical protein